MKSAVLFLVFNRPETARRSFERIREARPTRLYVHADGPRASRPGEAEKCAATRAIFDEIDWPCEVFRLFRDENWGLKRGVSDAITWFFRHEKMGIVLEDDCLADPSFFQFCDEILEKYADNQRIMHVSGHNWVRPEFHKKAESYIFTNYSLVGAWASWSRAWAFFDPKLVGLDDFKKTETWQRFLPGRLSRNYLMEKFEAVRAGRLDSWAFPWFFAVARNGGLGIVPRVNLVEDTGVGQPDATFTTGRNEAWEVPAQPIFFPLIHPKNLAADPVFDQKMFFSTHKSRARLWLWTVLQVFRKGKG